MALSVRSEKSVTDQSNATSLIGLLALASVVELLILRTFTRTAIHIPALHSLQAPYERVTEAAQYAYFVAITLLVPVLVLLAIHARRRSLVAVFALALFGAAGATAAFGASQRLVLDSVTILAVVLLAAAFLASRDSLVPGLSLAFFGLAFALSGAYSVVPEMNDLGMSLTQSALLLDGAELAGLAFAICTPLMLGRRDDMPSRWLGTATGVLILLLFLGSGSTSRFLLLWNVGLSGTLPALFYATATGALAFTIAGLFRQGRRLEAAGMLLLVAGGIGLHSTYQSGLVVAGLGALYCGLKPEKEDDL